jgi:hypothetical protein
MEYRFNASEWLELTAAQRAHRCRLMALEARAVAATCAEPFKRAISRLQMDGRSSAAISTGQARLEPEADGEDSHRPVRMHPLTSPFLISAAVVALALTLTALTLLTLLITLALLIRLSTGLLTALAALLTTLLSALLALTALVPFARTIVIFIRHVAVSL